MAIAASLARWVRVIYPSIVAEWGGKEFGLGVIRPECNIHGKEEFVYLQDIEDLAKIIIRLICPR